MRLLLLITIFLVWVILSGQNNNFYLICGLISAFITVLLYSQLHLHQLVRKPPIKIFKSIAYCFYLMTEIFKAAQAMIRIVWRKNLSVLPTYGIIDSKLPDGFSRTIYANSITLTPGTLTFKMNDNKIYVHSIDQQSFENLLDGKMEQKILRLLKK